MPSFNKSSLNNAMNKMKSAQRKFESDLRSIERKAKSDLNRIESDYNRQASQSISKLNSLRTTTHIPSYDRTIYVGNDEQTVNLYDGLQEIRKSEELEKTAIYDVFISHAREDKQDFVQPLVTEMQSRGIRVWYDDNDLQWGRSLRAQIDDGIRKSKYAIVVLSHNFFKKPWPQRELDGIISKEDIEGQSALPIWHNITYAEVYNYSPTMTRAYAYSTDKYTISDICDAFCKVLGM